MKQGCQEEFNETRIEFTDLKLVAKSTLVDDGW